MRRWRTVTTLTQPTGGRSDVEAATPADRQLLRRPPDGRVLRLGRTVLDLAGLALLVLWVGSRGSAFSGFPKGYDAWGHFSKTRFVIDNWPHIAGTTSGTRACRASPARTRRATTCSSPGSP